MVPEACPECGAVHRDENSCQAIFDSFLVLEFTDPGYGEVHLLTVACFMVQHGRYSDEGLAWIEKTMRLHLEGEVPLEKLRRQAARETRQDARAWKVTRRPTDPPLPPIPWSMTIADVAAQYGAAAQDALTYRELVKQWARTTLHEMKPWLPGD
jgi:hypothetical protein